MSFKLDLKIFLFFILFYFTKQIEVYSYILFFAAIHECGHLLAGILLGFKPENIILSPLGLSIQFKIFEDEYNKKIAKSNMMEVKKILIALAGPMTNLLIILLFCIFRFSNLNLELIIYSNLIICLFNLIPIYPLDGGRILKSFFSLLIGRYKANNLISVISNVFMIILTFFSSILVFYLENIAIFLITVYLWGIMIKENRAIKMKIKLYQMLEENRIKWNNVKYKWKTYTITFFCDIIKMRVK